MPLHNSEIWTTSSPFWVVQFHIMSPKFGQCHLPQASEVGIASSLLQRHVHPMSKSWWHSSHIFKVLLASFCILKVLIGASWNFKVLLASPYIFKVLMRAPCNVKVLAAFFLKLQGFVGISEILMRSPCIFKVLLASLNSWYLAIMLCTLDVWAILLLKIGAASL